MPQFPTIYAGQRITSSLLTSMETLQATKLSSTSRASTTTNTDDPDLTLSLPANSSYIVDGLILFAADPAADLKIGYTVPVSGTFTWSMFGQPSTTTTTSGTVITDGQSAGSTGFMLGGVTSNAKVMTAQMKGFLTLGSTAGAFTFQWSQGTSNALATSVQAGSYLLLHRVA